MRILIGGFGSRGDVQPMLALALVLRARGHDVTVCAPPDFEKWANELNLSFVAVGESIQQIVERYGSHVLLAGIKALPLMVAEHYDLLEPLARQADAMVASSLTAAGASFAEKFGIHYHYVAFSPSVIPSSEHPNPVVKRQTWPQWLNRLSWRVGEVGNKLLLGRVINAERERRSLPPIKNVWRHILGRNPLVASEPSLGTLPPETPAGTIQTGAWFFPESEELAPDLEAFLQAGPPPVYIGFGSMPDTDPVMTSRIVLDAVLRAGARALLSRGWAGLGRIELPPTVMVIGPAPHGKLFPRCSAVIHHGGAGTTATAARAGVPQFLVPHLLDQFYWCHRVWKLGLSPPPLHRSRLEVEPLAAAISRCVEDPLMRERARLFAAGVRTDGLDRAARIIEESAGFAANAGD